MITSAGVGSGIDIESIISQLMVLERQPLNNIRRKQADLDVQVSAFGSLKSAISELETAAKKLGDNSEFGRYVATSSNEDAFTATTTTGTAAELHSINVISLAEAHRLSSGQYASAADPVGTGTYSFSSGSDSFDITIDATNDSLTGLRDAINDATGNSSISASIINVDGGSRLVLTAKNSGTANSITAPALFTEIAAAKDASLEIDGFAVTSSTNSVSGVVPGVTLELKAIGTGNLSTARDTESVKEKLEEFATSYNKLHSTISSLREGSLKGESLLLNIESGLRQQFFAPIDVGNGETVSVFDLGFTFDKEGTLSLSESKMTAAMDSDLEKFISAFSDTTNGFSKQIEDSLKKYTTAGGLIGDRTDGLDSRKRTFDDQLERMEYRLEQTEVRYRKQFTAMDALVAQLQATSSFMTQQLSSLNFNSNR
ncbi:MAG TPA: flagellar cap protein [Chromatiales bacterium]|nr:flagellar cap protein [Thiotrichales bacterium]HIP69405.1 flagellar cap protein [Chromatiales bacterium]